MSSDQQPPPPKPRRSRKSIAVMPTSSIAQVSKENSSSTESTAAKPTRKSRSKSLGPGGLDALNGESNGRGLKDANGNGRRVSSIVPQAQVRSILKPTLPLSPIQAIPAHRSRGGNKQSSSLSQSSLQSSSASALLNFQPPPFPSNAVPTTVPVRTEEEQQKRAEILAARAARRQSLGNRRVSFAPEATLHTWDVVEYYRGDDGSSTPSSTGGSKASTPATASTNQTGDFSGVQATPTPSAAPDPRLPETPPSVHNKGNNLSAPTPPMNFNNPDDDFSSPFSSGTEGAQSPFAGMPEGGDSSDDDSLGDFGDDTAGGRTFVSAAGDTTAGDMSVDMEIADDEVTGAFKAFGKRTAWKLEGATETDEQPNYSEKDDETENLGEDMTMETTRPVGGLLPSVPQLAATRSGSDGDDGEMTMDMTRPVGGLLASPDELAATAAEEDVTADMDITRPIGGILGNAAKALERAKRRSLGLLPQPLVQYDDGAGEDEDIDMEMARPVGSALSSNPSKETSTFEVEDQAMDMDITRPVGGILSGTAVNGSPEFADEDQTMDMDVTRPIGGILSKASAQTPPAVDMGDQTMDITRPLGGIISAPQPRAPSPTSSDVEENEEMTMEFTNVLGGIIRTNKPSGIDENVEPRRGGLLGGDEWNKDQERLVSLAEEEGESAMDMTVAIGGILPSTAEVNEQAVKESASLYPKLPVLQGTQGADDTEEEGGGDLNMEDVTMDITTTIKSVMPSYRLSPASKSKPSTPQQTAKGVVLTPIAQSIAGLQEEMETATDRGSPTPAKRRASKRLSAVSATGSEKRITRRTSAATRKSMESAHSQSPVPAPVPVVTQPGTPQKKQETTKATPRATPRSTPATKVAPTAKAPSVTRSTPVKEPTPLTTEKRKEDFIFATPRKKLSTPQPCTPPEQLTPAVPVTKPKTPSKKAPIIETPLRAGGINEGYSMSAKKRIGFPTSPSPMKQKTPVKHATPMAFGSPMVTKGVGIDKPGLGSPRIAAKLSGRRSIGEEMPSFSPVTMPRDLIRVSREDDLADAEEERREKEREAERRKSLDLRSRIDMLTPRKASRKSLAYGALLAGAGKRERSDEASAVLGGGKRRKSMDGPITLGDNYGSATPQAKTPRIERPTLPTPGSGRRQTPRRRAVVIAPETPVIVEPANPAPVRSEEQSPEEEMPDQAFEEEGEEPRVSLQEFLNMTSITFLDGLTTTKRRQTGFPGLKKGRRSMDDEAEASLADCVIAGACTVPMLDLFQHSCRELKKYIREGREVVRTIEDDTLEENPLLFREYMEAPPDVKLIIDTQFKNVKTHARFLAKGIWYEWRMKLLEGVRTALEDNLKGLKDDETLLSEALTTGQELLPEIISRFETARSKLDSMREMKRRIEADDKAQLAIARESLQSVQSRIEQTKAELAQRKKDLEKLDAQLSERELRKQTLQSCIEEAERVKEMNRGWSEEEVSIWKSKVTALERKHGWSIISVVDGTMELLFLKQLRILWDSRARIVTGVKYVLPAISKPSDPIPLGDVETTFFIAALGKRLSGVGNLKAAVRIADEYWRNVLTVTERIRQVRRLHPTDVIPAEGHGEGLVVKVNVLIPEIRSKVRIVLSLDGDLEVSGGAKVVYGGVNEGVVSGFVESGVKTGAWRGVVEEVVGRCLDGRRKGGVGVPTKQ